MERRLSAIDECVDLFDGMTSGPKRLPEDLNESRPYRHGQQYASTMRDGRSNENDVFLAQQEGWEFRHAGVDALLVKMREEYVVDDHQDYSAEKKCHHRCKLENPSTRRKVLPQPGLRDDDRRGRVIPLRSAFI